jgi:hypothetical protein
LIALISVPRLRHLMPFPTVRNLARGDDLGPLPDAAAVPALPGRLLKPGTHPMGVVALNFMEF